MCFTTKDDRQIHTTAINFLARVPKERGGGVKLAMSRNKRKITAYLPDGVITGAITDFDESTQIIVIRPINAIDNSTDVKVPFSTPAERA